MIYEFNIKTDLEGFYNITAQVEEAVKKSGIESGIAIVHCPHTTAGITINENADPDVVHDLLIGLKGAYPERREFRHMEGNSTAHLKSSTMSPQQVIIVEGGKLYLGIWQGIYFTEFDGPRNRRFCVKVIPD